MIKQLMNKKGFTLIEVLVGMLMFSVLAISISAVMSPVLRSFAKANDLAETNTLLDNLSAELLSDLSEANSFVRSGTKLTIKTNADTVIYDNGTGENEGLLCRIVRDADDNEIERPVLDRQYYKGKTLDDIAYEEDDGVITVTLTLLLDAQETASRAYAVKPLGLTDT